METAIEILKRAMRTERFDEDGDPIQLALLPPMTDGELEQLRARLPCVLPEHIVQLLKFCRGFDGSPAHPVDLAGELAYEHEEIFPHGLPIAGDGYGNFWVVDLNANSVDFGPIYFACHDPPVIALQSISLASFLADLLISDSEDGSVIDFVHEQATFTIWKADPLARTRAEAVRSGDAELKAFSDRLPERFLIADLRGADIGEGFSWGRFGSDTRILRLGALPIFAYGPNK
jgi:hypothetical protein